MKCKILVFAITILCFATIAVAQPQIPTSNPPGGVLNLRGILGSDTDGGPAEAPSERELLCSDLVAFAFSESRDRQAQSRDSNSDILVRTFYPEEGLPYLRTRGRPRWGLSNHTLPRPSIPGLDYESRGLTRLDRAQRDHQTIQEQITILYNICKSTHNTVEAEN